jgi:phosphate transport system substrate-binding protein
MRHYILSLLIALSLGCRTENSETTTKGRLHLFIPESITPVMTGEINEFLMLYSQNGAQITYTITSSEEAAHRFVYDTGKIVFLPRSLTIQEKEQTKLMSSNLNEIIIAYDGIAAVVHPENKVEHATTSELQKILLGSITRWEQIPSAKPMKGKINIYCQDSSDVLLYLTKRLLRGGERIVNFIHTTSDIQTLQSVEKDPLSLGFSALDWIDSAKSTAKVLSLGRTHEDTDTTFQSSEDTKGQFYSPHPANIYRNYYPLKRPIYMYNRAQVDLAAGFGTYVATAEGQKLFLKHGLLPGTQRIKLRSE